ncbi:hypothetical protein SERLA73DRAFT_181927 [Serpula lacrymans var. lacrymans S7.3]|uniref:Cytochrome P450 n=2 Tax=Serpula lacrymans var. lacrymans TaxID=341189 RepID=F8PYZ3_SERL3|nr:uncharacterized protein SERLADRAFT_468346 [Serpula lacrymans var. lacrymans S7.9]EGN99106.1 hypothetical protein SERLA73DRAFT_181927 [Serpula lacrymans var. lacrymans S7.3]EGO24676.1 hypothetical protein SERLADRAFT_468346 [Serpula lacrymans var. lacrymans S7.9]
MSVIVSWSFLSLLVLLAVTARYRVRRRSIKDIRGPVSPSRLLGHEMQIRHQEEIGDLEFQWARQYGPTWRTQGCFGEDVLWTADPKTLQYIFHTSAYRFPKTKMLEQAAKNISGRGIVSVQGEVHQRQRKIMSPAFSAGQLRTFLPNFRQSAARLSRKWKDQIESSPSLDSAIINIPQMMARMTLDVIGEVAFDYRFGALDDQENELAVVFRDLFLDSMLHPPAWDVLFKATWRYIPDSILHYVRHIPTREYSRFKDFLDTSFRIGKDLVDQKASGTEKGSKDILSILVQSNIAEDAKKRLNEDEMLSQIATLLLAGHDTTANTLVWTLYELARHPEDQQKVRDEIAAARKDVETRGDEDFVPSDFDSMPFLNAVLKESLRLHPVGAVLFREAGGEDILPLSEPLETVSGKMIDQISVSKGQTINVSVCAYNRLQSVWGEDGDSWNPSRFLDSGKEGRTSVGVFANLMSFSAGIRACIGWRFALLEMQAVLSELVETLVFQYPEGMDIMRLNSGMMVPIIRGKLEAGIQLPLQVSLAHGA